MGNSGLEAEEPTTVGQMFKETVRQLPDHPALTYKEGEEWKNITYSEYYGLCVRAAKSFVKVGKLLWFWSKLLLLLSYNVGRSHYHCSSANAASIGYTCMIKTNVLNGA